MEVQELMTRVLITVKQGMDLTSFARLLVEKDISGAPVVDDNGKFLGIALEEGLVLKDKKIHLPTFIYFFTGFFTFGEHRFEEEIKKMAAITVEGIMDRNPVALSLNTQVEEVATLMVEKGIHYFPVLDKGDIVGVITRKDVVRAIAQNRM